MGVDIGKTVRASGLLGVTMALVSILATDTVAALDDATSSSRKAADYQFMYSPCPTLWQGATDIECPNDGIDGKKAPISFAVPLPPPEVRAVLESECGGRLRISVVFRPRDCYAAGSPLRKIWADVQLRLPTGEDSGEGPIIADDTCFVELPQDLEGVPLRSDGLAPTWPPFGVATTSIVCCETCTP